jgi:hypothetical protein
MLKCRDGTVGSLVTIETVPAGGLWLTSTANGYLDEAYHYSCIFDLRYACLAAA